MENQPLNGAEPIDPLAGPAEAYGKALIASMSNGPHVNLNMMQLVMDASIALRLGEFVAEKLAPLLGKTVNELKVEFGQNLLALTAQMPKPSGIVVAPARDSRRR
ncbi:MAG: hypothetical protein JWO52_4068 [Gammaproteobacteria bacterium]|nr:hypothetical protein [Gammaproteobacteria bacterium]